MVNRAEIAEDVEDWNATITQGWELLNARDIGSFWSDYADTDTLSDPALTPFGHDNGGNYLCLTPAGEVVEVGMDVTDGPITRAGSLVGFLEGEQLSAPAAQTGKPSEVLSVTTPRPLRADEVPAGVPQLTVTGYSTVAGTDLRGASALRTLGIKTARCVDLSGLDALPLRELSLELVSELRGVDTLADIATLETVTLGDPLDPAVLMQLGRHPGVTRVQLQTRVPFKEQVDLANLVLVESPVVPFTASGTW